MGEDIGRRLDSWKEIAEYIGRDVRTAIRWERERRLPVHRVPGGRRGVVFAYAGEIDEWRAGHPSPPKGASLPETAADAAGGLRRRVLSLGVVLGVLAIIGAFVVGAVVMVRAHGPRPSDRRIARVAYAPEGIQALNGAGQPLWRHVFERPLEVGSLKNSPSPRYAVVDLDRDGAAELVTTVTQAVSPRVQQDELYCFSETGVVRWRRKLDDVVSFRGGTFGPPWTDGHVVAYEDGGKARIAWSQNREPSWPSVVTVLDGSGRRLSTFVHSGSTYSLSVLEGPDGPLVLGGGVSNSARAASLYVLDGRAAAGHSIEPEGSAHECLSCPPGRPLRYLLFPPTEINATVGLPYNNVFQILPRLGSLDVDTMEGLAGPPYVAEQHFTFSHDFALQRAGQSDSWSVHERLEREGKLRHSVADCPMYRTPPPVRAWDPVGGWRELKPRDQSPVTVGPRARRP